MKPTRRLRRSWTATCSKWVRGAASGTSRWSEACGALAWELARSSATSTGFDYSGGVRIGEYITVAGVRSTILSHEIDLAAGVQTSKTTQIGDFCFVSSNVCLTPGSSIHDRSVVAMGAVVVGHLEQASCLYGRVPMRVLR